MIVVVSQPGDRSAEAIARAAARAGGRVQFVSRVADDPDGDRRVLSLATAGVGHVATLRQPPPASPLDAADLDLALRYLDGMGALVLSAPDEAIARTAIEAAGWDQARLIVTVPHGSVAPAGVPETAIVLEAPTTDPDEAFATVVGDLAVRLDAGVEPAVAFAAAMADQPAWTQAGSDTEAG